MWALVEIINVEYKQIKKQHCSCIAIWSFLVVGKTFFFTFEVQKEKCEKLLMTV